MSFNKRYEIEVGSIAEPGGEGVPGGNCGNYHFPPLNTTYRGRVTAAIYSAHDMSERMRSFFRRFREVPGVRIWIDFSKKDGQKGPFARYGVYDGLDAKAFESDRDRILDFFSKEFESGKKVTTTKAVEGDLTNYDRIKDFLYWMRRAVDAGYAFVPDHKEPLPKMDRIVEMYGRRMVPGVQGSSDKETKRILAEYDHYVEPPGQKQGV